jgi:hypothetical protein
LRAPKAKTDDAPSLDRKAQGQKRDVRRPLQAAAVIASDFEAAAARLARNE